MIFVLIIGSMCWSSQHLCIIPTESWVQQCTMYSNVLGGRSLAINRILRVSRVVITKHHHVASNTLHNFCVQLIALIWLYWYTLLLTSFLVHHKHGAPSDFLQCTKATTPGAWEQNYAHVSWTWTCALILITWEHKYGRTGILLWVRLLLGTLPTQLNSAW